MKKLVYFVRHGESEANAGLRTAKAESIPLTTKGHKQAFYLNKALPSHPDLIITSSYLRTKQTAKPFIDYGNNGVFQIEWNIHEFNYLTNCDNTTIEERRPFSKIFWERQDVDYQDGPDTESFRTFADRIDVMWEKLQKSEAKSIVVFCHGHFIRGIIWFKYFDKPITSDSMGEFYRFSQAITVPNASIVSVDLNEDTFSKIYADHIPLDMRTV